MLVIYSNHETIKMSIQIDIKRLDLLLARVDRLLSILDSPSEKKKAPITKKLKILGLDDDGKPKKPVKHYKPLPKTWPETIIKHLETGKQQNPFTIEQLLSEVLLLEPTDYSTYAKAKIYKYLIINGICSAATKRSHRSRDWYFLNGERIQRDSAMQKYKDGFELCYYPNAVNDELNDLI